MHLDAEVLHIRRTERDASSSTGPPIDSRRYVIGRRMSPDIDQGGPRQGDLPEFKTPSQARQLLHETSTRDATRREPCNPRLAKRGRYGPVRPIHVLELYVSA
jgi:hypothetical protein